MANIKVSAVESNISVKTINNNNLQVKKAEDVQFSIDKAENNNISITSAQKDLNIKITANV